LESELILKKGVLILKTLFSEFFCGLMRSKVATSHNRENIQLILKTKQGVIKIMKKRFKILISFVLAVVMWVGISNSVSADPIDQSSYSGLLIVENESALSETTPSIRGADTQILSNRTSTMHISGALTTTALRHVTFNPQGGTWPAVTGFAATTNSLSRSMNQSATNYSQVMATNNLNILTGLGTQGPARIAPTRAGYTFAGWFTAATGGTRVNHNTAVTPGAGAITLHARWQANVAYSLNTPTASNITSTSATINGSFVGTSTNAGMFIRIWRSSTGNSWFNDPQRRDIWVNTAATNGSGSTTFTGLTAGTGYFIQAVGWDSHGRQVDSGIREFRTIAGPQQFIWHSDVDRVGFWPGAVNVYNRTLGVVAPTFNFNAQMTHARNQWSNALGIPIGTATYANAQVRGFGGQRAAIDAFRGTGPTTWAGWAQWTWFNHATISVAGRQRTVHRMSTARIFTIDLPGWTGESHRRMSTMITTHELGHALGWDGHPHQIAANNQDVMWWQAHQNYFLRPNEIRHLRQIYDFYR